MKKIKINGLTLESVKSLEETLLHLNLQAGKKTRKETTKMTTQLPNLTISGRTYTPATTFENMKACIYSRAL